MANRGATERPVMELRITGLPDGERPFSFEVDATELDLPRFVGEVRAHGLLRRVSTQFFVQGQSEGTFVGECDRCLAEVRRDVRAPLNLFYQVEAHASDAEKDLEIQSIHPEQDVIVLDDEVRQTLMLEVPLKVLCTDECAGICPGCGANLNSDECQCAEAPIDPRWAKLAEIYKKKEQ
jgi:uncharacterized protein